MEGFTYARIVARELATYTTSAPIYQIERESLCDFLEQYITLLEQYIAIVEKDCRFLFNDYQKEIFCIGLLSNLNKNIKFSSEKRDGVPSNYVTPYFTWQNNKSKETGGLEVNYTYWFKPIDSGWLDSMDK